MGGPSSPSQARPPLTWKPRAEADEDNEFRSVEEAKLAHGTALIASGSTRLVMVTCDAQHCCLDAAELDGLD